MKLHSMQQSCLVRSKPAHVAVRIGSWPFKVRALLDLQSPGGAARIDDINRSAQEDIRGEGHCSHAIVPACRDDGECEFELCQDAGYAVGNLLLLASKDNLKQRLRDDSTGTSLHLNCHSGTLHKVSSPLFRSRRCGCVSKGTSRESQGSSSQAWYANTSDYIGAGLPY